MPRRFEGLDVHLRIIGEPSDADHRMLKQLGVEYSTQSKLTDAEMQEAYATSDFLLFRLYPRGIWHAHFGSADGGTSGHHKQYRP